MILNNFSPCERAAPRQQKDTTLCIDVFVNSRAVLRPRVRARGRSVQRALFFLLSSSSPTRKGLSSSAAAIMENSMVDEIAFWGQHLESKKRATVQFNDNNPEIIHISQASETAHFDR